MQNQNMPISNTKIFSIENLYEGNADNLLKAYSHNREAVRLHERGFLQASKHHAQIVLYFSDKLNESIVKTLKMVDKLTLDKSLIMLDQTLISEI